MALYPAVIKEYNAQTKRVRIEMKGLTDGDTLLPESELLYSLGDKFNHTEIEIKAGDTVWVDFLANDPRYPIVVGYRNPEQGNAVGWRKWHHANMELSADNTMILKTDNTMILKGKTLKIEFPNITISGTTTHNGNIALKGALSASSDVSAGGISMQNHTHIDGDGEKTQKPSA